MRRSLELYKQFITWEKLFIIIITLLLMFICTHYTYMESVYSQGYMNDYRDAPLEFFYYIQSAGINPFIFMIMMLLLPNIVSYDLLNQQQNHTTYLIETRIGKSFYYRESFKNNVIVSAAVILFLEIALLLFIHVMYGDISFTHVIYPDNYHALTQTICENEFLNLIFFLILTSSGYSLLSTLLFSIQVFVSHKYIYRCSGVILGISLIVLPILVMGYFPIHDIAVLFQINPLIAIGVEHVRVNPFQLSNIQHYCATFMIYTVISFILYKILVKWRKTYD